MPEDGIKTEEKPLKRDDGGLFVSGTAPGPGRPKGSFSISTMMKNKMQEIPLGQVRSYAESMVLDIIEAAVVKKDFNAMKTIWSYIDGAPKQKLEVGGDKESISELTEFFRQVANPPTGSAGMPPVTPPAPTGQ